jgi:hypothetical protein
MNLKTFFAIKNVPSDVTCVSVGTDGLSLERNNVLSVSFCTRDGEVETVYVRGADAERVEPYTGVDPDYYQEHAVGILRAEEILRDKIDTDMVVSFTVNKFTRRWLSMAFPTIFGPGRRLWFDVLSYIRYCDEGNPFPADAEKIDDVCKMVNAVNGIKFNDAVSSRLTYPELMNPVEKLPVLEQRIHHLKDLWSYCLNKEL